MLVAAVKNRFAVKVMLTGLVVVLGATQAIVTPLANIHGNQTHPLTTTTTTTTKATVPDQVLTISHLTDLVEENLPYYLPWRTHARPNVDLSSHSSHRLQR
jgi:hypothetical protein